MDIRIEWNAERLPARLSKHARQRLTQVLLHRRGHVERVDVRLGEATGARGGGDTYCLVQVTLAGTFIATVVDVGREPYGTIDRAVDRAGRLADEHRLSLGREAAARKAATVQA